MSSKNQIIAEAFQSIREFITAQQTQLDVQLKRLDRIEPELTRLDDLEKRSDNVEEQQTLLGILEQRLDKKQQQQKTRLEILDKRTDNIERGLINQIELALVRLNNLEAQLNDAEQRTRELAYILPKAIREASQVVESPTTDEVAELSDSLQKPVEQCIKHSIREDTRTFADALFPVMGPAIRKSIQESFKSILQTINKTAEQSLSPQGLVWRFEARRKGVAFSEIVLQHTIVFQVEQVFLIHRESGLLILHQHRENVKIGDSDAVSAMLTAIQDFIHDSFSSTKTEELDSVEIGEHTVWLERGPHAVLACVIRGVASLQLRDIMRSSLEIMHARYGLLLQQFSGDNMSLHSCVPFLEKTLKSESKKNVQKQQRLLSPQLIGIFSTILLAVSWWGFGYFQYQQRLTDYIDALENAPGIVVISTKPQNGKLFIYGIRDPLAVKPRELAKNFELSDDNVETVWTPYQDLTPQFIEQRLRQRLAAPSTVHMRMQGEVLHLSGHASPDWIEQAKTILAAGIVTGIDRVVIDKLLDTDQFLLALAKRELAPPDDVTLTVQDGVLRVIGHIDTMTFEALQQGIQNLPTEAFASFDVSGLRDVERERKLIIQIIENINIYFLNESAEFILEQGTTLQALHKNVQKLLVLSQMLHKAAYLQIIGYTDGRGEKIYNQQLSQQRAEIVHNWLHSRGIETDKLIITPPTVIRFGESEANPSDRKVSFQIIYTKAQ